MAAKPASAMEFDGRSEPRDPVHFRARGYGPDARAVSLLIVNMSARGLMARCEAVLVPGDRVTVALPVVGVVVAEVRWALGGRIGCQLDDPLPPAAYYEMLATMLKS